MLARGASSKAATRCGNACEAGILLPFLYQTSTILRRHFHPTTATLEGEEAADQSPRKRSFAWQDDIRHEQGPRIRRHGVAGEQYWTLKDENQGRSDARLRYFSQKQPRADTSRDSRHGQANTSGNPRPERRKHQKVDHVPFDRAASSSGGTDPNKSTITPGEKRVFEKLFALKKDKTVTTARPAPKQQEDDNDDEIDSIDSILDKAVHKIKAQQPRPAQEFPAALKPMADEALARRERKLADKQERKRTKGVQHDLDTTNALLDAAETDVDLFRALETHVLGRVVSLNLDARPKAEKSDYELGIRRSFQRQMEKAKGRENWYPFGKENLTDLQVMTANFPDHLLHYFHTSTTKFPGSVLPLNTLPTLKRLGPSAFTLGATTALYNTHMRLLYAKFPFDLQSLVEVLEEMDREVYPFDEDTEALLEKILRDARKYAEGKGGPSLQLMWRTERMRRALKGLMGWREEMARRREEEALKKAGEEEALREVGLGLGEEDVSAEVAAL